LGARLEFSAFALRACPRSCHVHESIVIENENIGTCSRIRRAIIDKDVTIPSHTEIGHNRDDNARKFTVTESGLVVILKGMELHAAVDPSG